MPLLLVLIVAAWAAIIVIAEVTRNDEDRLAELRSRDFTLEEVAFFLRTEYQYVCKEGNVVRFGNTKHTTSSICSHDGYAIAVWDSGISAKCQSFKDAIRCFDGA